MTVTLAPAAQMLGWLLSPSVVNADGRVMSWSNPQHAGYPYPEIAGYLLSLLALEGESTLEIRDRIARRLVSDISPAGGVGRDGADYVFDSAMALAGLIAHESAGGVLSDDRSIDRLFDFVTVNLAARQAGTGLSTADPDHWSVSYGCHLLKAVIALYAYDERRPRSTTSALVDRLVAELTGLYDNGRFRANASSLLTYLHSCCYAIEGLLVLQGRRHGEYRDLIRGSARWLAEIQTSEGGLRAFHDGRDAFGTLHTDATAQAVRIWSLVDAAAFQEPIARGVGFLAEMTTPGGGLRYEPGSDDVNTWATIFGLQAVQWSFEGGDWQWIV
jgi:hypothetical protein